MPTPIRAYLGATPLFEGAPPIVGAKIIKTGQTTSFATGDDGGLQEGRDVDFFTLATNNPFGNTNRFTALDGSQTYTSDIVIDWSTYDNNSVLGWRRTHNGANIDWASAISEALNISILSYTTGWRVPNINEISSIVKYGSGTDFFLNYLPFNQIFVNFWTSTTIPNDSLTAYRFTNQVSSNIFIGRSVKTTSIGFRYIPCRNFTVTGTTLT
jgi:hypothetical protein